VTNRRLNPGAYVERLSGNVWHGRGAKKSLDHVADVDKIARLPPARQLDGVTVRGAVDHIGDKPMRGLEWAIGSERSQRHDVKAGSASVGMREQPARCFGRAILR